MGRFQQLARGKDVFRTLKLYPLLVYAFYSWYECRATNATTVTTLRCAVVVTQLLIPVREDRRYPWEFDPKPTGRP